MTSTSQGGDPTGTSAAANPPEAGQTKNKGGRPPLPESAYVKVLEGLEAGLSLRKVCKQRGAASVKRVLLRAAKEPDTFGARYAQARHLGLLQMEEQMLQLVDDIELSETNPKLANAEVQRVRLQVDTRKWLMSKMRPERYGDRVALTGDKSGAPIKLSNDEAARELALILATAVARKAAAEKEASLATAGNRLAGLDAPPSEG